MDDSPLVKKRGPRGKRTLNSTESITAGAKKANTAIRSSATTKSTKGAKKDTESASSRAARKNLFEDDVVDIDDSDVDDIYSIPAKAKKPVTKAPEPKPRKQIDPVHEVG